MMLVALLLSVLGVTSVKAAKDQLIDLEKGMFKAWTSPEPGAAVDPEPANEPKGAAFGCAYALYESIGTGATIYGSPNVYANWYADITGTKKIIITGTPGIKPRLMLNREAPVEPDGEGNYSVGDADGGSYIEIADDKIPADGVLEIDLENNAKLAGATYLHLNAIKTPWGDTETGVIKSIQLYGTTKAVTGWVDLINNGDVEDGDDLESFPVSHNGPNNGGTANDRPIIVDEGGDHGNVLKVTSDDRDALNVTDTWSTQFFLKFTEALPEGTKYKIEFDYKASKAAEVSTSAQGEPRAWHDGFLDGNIQFGTEWQSYSYTGTVDANDAKDGGFLSAAFDLSNSAEPIDFFFDNVHFYKWVEPESPMSKITGAYGQNAVAIDLAGQTNVLDLIKAAGGKRLIYPEGTVTVTWNGQELTKMLSIEARPDGKLYAFIDVLDAYSDMMDEEIFSETATVEVAFNNPEDKALRLVMLNEQALPNFKGLACPYNVNLGENQTYRSDVPTLISSDPEQGSFNLPRDKKEFKITFDVLAQVEGITAEIAGEKLTVNPVNPTDDGLAKEFVLTRESTSDLPAGVQTLAIANVLPEFDFGYGEGEYNVQMSFGPSDPNATIKELWNDNFASTPNSNSLPDGWETDSDGNLNIGPFNGGGSGTCTRNGDYFASQVLYVCSRNGAGDGHAAFGAQGDEHAQIELDAETYHLEFDVTQWDRDGDRWLKTQVKDLEGNVIAEDKLKVTMKLGKEAQHVDLKFTLTEKTKIALWFYPGDENGNTMGWNDGLAMANFKIQYKPDVFGIEETVALNTALEKATTTRDNNADERYAGDAFTAIDGAITTYTEGKATYTAPSQFLNAAADLDAKREAMNAHREACDNYDNAIKKTLDIVRQIGAEQDNGQPNEKHKFAVDPLYTKAVEAAAKYNGKSEWVDLSEDPENPNVQLQYTFDKLTDDNALKAAVEELNDVNFADKIFTVGASSNNSTTGYAAEHERLRRGVALLKKLGVADDASEIVNANAVFGDDDDAAEAIINRAKLTILKNIEKLSLGEYQEDENLEETFVSNETYDLTVFAKNPNIYIPAKTTEVPGWTKVRGNAYGWTSWDGNANHSDNTAYPEDGSLHAGWHPNPGAIVEQTITGLPAGLYQIKVTSSDNNSPVSEGTETFIKLSDTPAPNTAESEEFDLNAHTADHQPASGTYTYQVEIKDGLVTVGMAYGTGSQAFLNGIEIILIGKAKEVDYEKEFTNGIDSKTAAPVVRDIKVFDLNGRRQVVAKKGLNIVKKTLSDGTVVTEKIVKN